MFAVPAFHSIKQTAVVSKASPIPLTSRHTQARDHLLRGAELRGVVADTCVEEIISTAQTIAECFKAGGKLMICGNGGSAADSQHMAAEFVNRLSGDCERPGLPALALTTDTSFLTAYANDYGYSGAFERQLTTLGNAGDVLIVISTSGNSENLIRAVTGAQSLQIKTIGLLGDGGRLTSLVDQAIVIPSRDTQQVQELLLAVEHTICMLVEADLFAGR